MIKKLLRCLPMLCGAQLLGLCLFVTMQAQSTSEVVTLAATGGITGLVTTQDGKSAEGVDVTAFSDTLAAKRARVSAAGRYTITDLPPGPYHVRFNLEPSGKVSLPGYRSEYYSNKAAAFEADQVVVFDGQNTQSIDATLEKSGAITGVVTAFYNSQPLPGVLVQVDRLYSSERYTTTTDLQGRYEINGLITQGYRVCFFPPSGTENFLAECYNDQSVQAEADQVDVAIGAVTPAINAAIERSSSLRGQVTITDSVVGAAGIKLVLYDATGKLITQTQTQADGVYSVGRLRHNTYRLRVELDTPQYFYNGFYASAPIYDEATPVVISDGQTIDNLNVAIKPYPQAPTIQIVTSKALPNVVLINSQDQNAAASSPARGQPWFTLDGGQFWQRLGSQPWFGGASEINVAPRTDPNAPVRMMVLAYPDATQTSMLLYRSGDQGATWSTFDPASTNCHTGNVRLQSLINSAADSNRLYVTGVYSGNFNAPDYCLFTTADAGLTWQAVTLTLPYPRADLRLVASPLEPALLYRRYSQGAGIKYWDRSPDNGLSWFYLGWASTDLVLDRALPSRYYHIELGAATNLYRYPGSQNSTKWQEQPCYTSYRQLVALATANTLLMLCDQGIYRSRNGGDHWEKLSVDKSSGFTYDSLAVDYAVPTRVFWARQGEIWASTDEGNSWTQTFPNQVNQHLWLPLVGK